jgi:hypothetical protein
MNCKGTSFITMVEYLKKNFSATKMEQLAAALTPEDRQVFNFKVAV